MYETLSSISVIFFFLSAFSAGLAAYVFVRCDIKGYRELIAHDRGRVPAGKKRNAGTAPSDYGGTEKEKVPDDIREDDAPKGTADPEGVAGGNRALSFTMRTVSESDRIRREREAEEDTGDEDGSSVTENLDAEPGGQERAGNEGEGPDGITALTDGSDDTTYLRKTETVPSAAETEEDILWMPEGLTMRTSESVVVTHTDRTIGQITASLQIEKEE